MALRRSSADWHLPAMYAIAFVTCAAVVRRQGMAPAVPTDLVIFVVLSLPMTIALLCWQRRFSTNPWAAMAVVGTAAGLGISLVDRWPAAWLVLAIASVIAVRPAIGLAAGQRILYATITAVLGYGTVWNANVIAGRAVRDRTVDHWVRSADVFVYDRLGLMARGHEQLFPLLHSSWLLRSMSGAYLLIIPEVFIAITLAAWSGRVHADRLLRTIFTGYGIGLAVFLLFPAVGPCIAFPDSVNFAALPPQASALMTAMAAGFKDVAAGSDRPVIAYFVALPSLHVFVALALQWHLRRFRFVAACFAPVNVLAVLSTVVLGYHYVMDVASALVMAPLVLAVCDPEFRELVRRLQSRTVSMVHPVRPHLAGSILTPPPAL